MKVSVLMVTYNQERYIAQAVESVLMQKTDFDVELVIGEDFSKDRTREILLDLQAKHPDRIKLLPSEVNLGVNRNIARTFQACTGKYLAFLDGDDYWTSPDKLQKQVDYLESHPELTVCFHNAWVVNEDGSQVLKEADKPDQKPISTIEDIIQHNFIMSCTAMYRNGLITTFPEWWYHVLNADWTLHIFHAQHGNIGYIPEILAAYRFNPEGIWRRLDYEHRLEARIRTYTAMNRDLEFRYDSTFQPALSDLWRRLRDVYIEKGFRLGLKDVHVQNVSKMFEDVPEDVTFPPEWKVEVMSEVYDRLLFHFYQNQQPSNARYCCVHLAQLRPSRLRDKGVLKVGAYAFLGAYLPRLSSK